MDDLRASPRNRLMGMIADALGAANNYAQKQDLRGGAYNPPLSMAANALALPSLATTADRMSYGSPLTNAGQANVPFLKPETADALMMAPLSPRTALGAAGLAAGIGDTNALRAATVWHGSPHKFDKFDASKIGTGEGAQAYGHGLYLAESPAVAKDYAEKLSSAGLARHTLAQNAGQTDAAIAAAEQSVRNYQAIIANGGGGDPRRAQGMLMLAQKKLDDLQSMKAGTLDEAGSIYKVDLPDKHIKNMLDWDRPLSQQAPGVQAAIGPMFGPNAGQLTGQDIYKKASAFDSMVNVASKTGGNIDRMKSVFPQATDVQIQQAIAAAKNTGSNDRIAAQMLRDAGIPGIRYLDGGSRTAGQGSSNYVMFPGNENMLQILERNGQPLPR